MNEKEKLLQIQTPSELMLKINKDQNGLVFHSNKTIRSSVVKSLSDLGVPANHVKILSGSFEEFESEIKENMPQIVICSDFIGEQSFKNALKVHEEVYPNRMEALFIVLSSEGSLSSGTVQLDHFIDGFISLPFTPQTLNNTLISAFDEKYGPSEGFVAFSSARSEYLKGNLDLAKDLFLKGCEIDSAKAMSYGFLALIAHQEDKDEEAIELYRKGLEADPNHYFCLYHLTLLFESLNRYEDAYQLNKKILATYPLNYNHIPMIIKLAVATKNYDDILGILDVLKEIESLPTGTKHYLAAGLVIGGKLLFENKQPKSALKSITSALELAEKAPKIFKRGCLLAAEYGLKKEAIGLLEKFSGNSITDEDFSATQIEILYLSKDYQAVLKAGKDIMDGKIKNSRCYEFLIKSAVATELSSERIDHLIENAGKSFPDEAERFLRLK